MSTSHRILLLAATALLALAPTASALTFGSFGTFVDTLGDDDFVVDFADVGDQPAGYLVCFGFIEDPDNTGDEDKYAWFLHIDDGDADCDVDAGAGEEAAEELTYQYTGFGGSASAGWLDSGDDDYVGEQFTQLEPAGLTTDGADFLCWVDHDGTPGFGLGDAVYIDHETFTGSGTTGTLTPDDLRLAGSETAYGAQAATSMGLVTSSSADYDAATDTDTDLTIRPIDDALTCEEFVFAFVDLDDADELNEDDAFYLVHDADGSEAALSGDLPITSASGSNFVSAGMVRLATPSGLSASKHVHNGDADHADGLEAVTTAFVAWADASDDPEDDGVYIHFTDPDGTDDDVLAGDVVVRKLDTGDDAEVDADSDLGELATTTALNLGQDITYDADFTLQKMLYYVDDDADGVFDTDEPVYLKHPTNAGDGTEAGTGVWGTGGSCVADAAGERCIEEGDIRILVDGEDTGSIVVDGTGNDFDEFSSEVAHAVSSAADTSTLALKVFREKLDERAPLTAIGTHQYCDIDSNSVWNPTLEPIFVINSGAANDLRIWNLNAEDSTTQEATTGCAVGVLRTGLVKTPGPITTFDDLADLDDSQSLYWSADGFLSVGDYRLLTVGSLADGVVTESDAAFSDDRLLSAGVTLSISYATAFPFPQVNDVILFKANSASNVGDRLDADSSDVVPKVAAIPGAQAPEMIRTDPEDTASVLDDCYYLDFTPGNTGSQDREPENTVRIAGCSAGDAGEFLDDADEGEETIEAASASGVAEDEVGYAENGNNAVLDANDYLYWDTQELGGDGVDDEISRSDIRATAVNEDDDYDAGSIVQLADDDYALFNGDALEDAGSFNLAWWDADLDGEVNEDDMLWLHNGAVGVVPGLFDVRVVGSGGSSGGGGGGGGSNDDDDDEPESDPPVAALSVSPDSGDAPLDVTFTIAAVDPEDDDLNWELDADGDGTADETGTEADLPATFDFTFDEAGEYTAVLTVSDADNDVTDRVDIEVLAEDVITDDPSTDDVTSDDVTSDDATSDDVTTDEVTKKDNGSPGLAVPMILAGLAAAFIVARRKA